MFIGVNFVAYKKCLYNNNTCIFAAATDIKSVSASKDRIQSVMNAERCPSSIETANDVSFIPTYSSTLHALLKPSLLPAKLNHAWPSGNYPPLTSDIKHLVTTSYDEYTSRVSQSALTSSMYIPSSIEGAGMTIYDSFQHVDTEPYLLNNYPTLNAYDAFTGVGYGVCQTKSESCYDNCHCDDKTDYEDYHKS